MTESGIKRRGFASMDKERHRAIAGVTRAQMIEALRDAGGL